MAGAARHRILGLEQGWGGGALSPSSGLDGSTGKWVGGAGESLGSFPPLPDPQNQRVIEVGKAKKGPRCLQGLGA